MTDTTTTQDPEAIERDIRQTQERMSRTVDKIGDQLSIKNVVNALLDKADESNVDARMVLDGARRNPIALSLIAAGTIWLISDSDSKFPSFGSRSSGEKSSEPKRPSMGGRNKDIGHHDYVAHMASIQPNEGEDAAAYQRRRDLARSNFFMVERGHDEDEGTFRQRLDDIADKFRRTRHDWADSASSAASSAQDTMSGAMSSASQAVRGAMGSASSMMSGAADRTQDLYTQNPLIGGVVAAALGAIAGLTVPLSRPEQNALGEIGGKARDMIGDSTRQAGEQLRQKKDELLDKADEALRPQGQHGGQQASGQGGQQGSPQQGGAPQGGAPQGGAQGIQSDEKPPFILAQ